jgi:hypothetical protein
MKLIDNTITFFIHVQHFTCSKYQSFILSDVAIQRVIEIKLISLIFL